MSSIRILIDCRDTIRCYQRTWHRGRKCNWRTDRTSNARCRHLCEQFVYCIFMLCFINECFASKWCQHFEV